MWLHFNRYRARVERIFSDGVDELVSVTLIDFGRFVENVSCADVEPPKFNKAVVNVQQNVPFFPRKMAIINEAMRINFFLFLLLISGTFG